MAHKITPKRNTMADDKQKPTKKEYARRAGMYAAKNVAAAGAGTVISGYRKSGKKKRASWITAVLVVAGGIADIFGDPAKATTQIASATGLGASAASFGDAISSKVIEAKQQLDEDEDLGDDVFEDDEPAGVVENLRDRAQAPAGRFREEV